MPFGQTASKKEVPKKNSPPVFKERAGTISGSVWEQTSKEGNTFQTVTTQRSYKDEKEGWKNTDSYRINDLPKLILVLQRIYEKAVIAEKTDEKE